MNPSDMLYSKDHEWVLVEGDVCTIGLPIARRYFTDLDEGALEDTLGRLARQGSIMRYPPLVEEEGVMVSQTEHSMFLGPDGVEILTA